MPITTGAPATQTMSAQTAQVSGTCLENCLEGMGCFLVCATFCPCCVLCCPCCFAAEKAA
jgi:hypothetical protein